VTGACRAPGRAPEEGIEVLAWPVEELWRATRSGEFALSLHIAVLMQAVLAGMLPLR
jgi:hypothetical protein